MLGCMSWVKSFVLIDWVLFLLIVCILDFVIKYVMEMEWFQIWVAISGFAFLFILVVYVVPFLGRFSNGRILGLYL